MKNLEDQEQREYEQQKLVRELIAQLHGAYADKHMLGFANVAAVLLCDLTSSHANMADYLRREPPVAKAFKRIELFARTDAERRYLEGRVLTEVIYSINCEVGRDYTKEMLLG